MQDSNGEQENKGQHVKRQKLCIIPYDRLFGNFNEARKVPLRLMRAARKAAREGIAIDTILAQGQLQDREGEGK